MSALRAQFVPCALTKILPPASFVFCVNDLCNSKVEARPSRVDELNEREGFDDGSVKGKVAETRAGVFRPGRVGCCG
jgi:hypothetical protein